MFVHGCCSPFFSSKMCSYGYVWLGGDRRSNSCISEYTCCCLQCILLLFPSSFGRIAVGLVRCKSTSG
jgi:hypothetical protein